jgi:ABC-type transport system involved in multi-copper enzyme maturation permease subunit
VIRTILEIARHEIWAALRTRRFLWIAGVYLGCVLLGGVLLFSLASIVERWLVGSLVEQGADPSKAADMLALASEPAYQKIAAWFADTDRNIQVASSLSSSIVLLLFFWLLLKFLPFLILLTSFDQVSGDLQSRSICFSTLRARRRDILYGKMLAQTAVFMAVTGIGFVVLGVTGAVALEEVTASDVFLGMARMWLALLPFGVCYLAMSAAASSFFREPFVALIAAFALILFLWGIQLFGGFGASESLAWLRHVELLSPASYEDGLWLSGLTAPAAAAAAHIGFALVFVAAATWRLGGRDL